MKYSIGDIAHITGISRDRLRHYEKLQIITPSRSDENQYRLCDDQDIVKLLLVDMYRNADYSLTDIHDICEDSETIL